MVEHVTPRWVIILVIVLAVLLFSMITLVIILLIKKKKDNSVMPADAVINDNVPVALKPSVPSYAPKPSNSQSLGKNEGKVGGHDTGVMNMSIPDVKGTTVLEINDDESSGPRLVSGTLIRKRDLKSILIDKEEFSVGKDSLHVSYCINDNVAISRTHAIFKSDETGVYVEDCNSTNGTFVNGRRRPAGQPVLLMNGDVVKLANEEFAFKS